jgi:hypothetical protein
MTDVQRLLGEQGHANRWLGEEILQQRYLEAMHTAASQPRRGMNVYGSTCPLCCGDVDAAAFVRTGMAACSFCYSEPAPEQSRSRWLPLEMASAMASSYGQGQAQHAPK